MKIQVLEGDILEQKVEAIVNPWNQNVPFVKLIPHGLSGLIRQVGGEEIFTELKKKGFMRVGQAVITGPGKLPFKYIIHVAGIHFLSWKASEMSIKLSVANALAVCKKYGIKSVAFPLIGAGIGKIDPELVLKYINDTLLERETEYADLDVYIVQKL